MLASRAEDRRALVEEAAGLGKFKRRKHRAELKLARVATQVERARDVEDEVRKRLRPLALQATAAERAEKIAVEIGALLARIAQLDLEAVGERRDAAESRRDAAAIARRGAQERLTGLLEQRQRAEDELSDAAGKREAALGGLYRLQGAGERLALRREAAETAETRLREELDEARRALAGRDDEATRTHEESARGEAAAARDAARDAGQAAERARLAHARLAAAERRMAGEAEARLEELRAERSRAEAGLAEAVGGRDVAARAIVAVGTCRERLALRGEAAAALAAELRAAHEQARAIASRGGPTPAELELQADESSAAARAARTERDDLAERARSARERLLALERSLAEREGLPPAARVLAESGERLALAALDVEPGLERAVAAALGSRAAAVLAVDPRAALALLLRARDEGLGSLTVVAGREPAELVAELPVVRLDELLDATRPSVTAEGFGYDPPSGELWFAGETAEAVLLELESRRRALADEAEELVARAGAAAQAATEAEERARGAEEAYAAVAHLRERSLDAELLARMQRSAGALEMLCGRAGRVAAAADALLSARSETGGERSGALGDELRRLGAVEADARRTAADAAARAQAAEVVVARLGGSPEAPLEAEVTDAASLRGEAEAQLQAAELAATAAREAADRARGAERDPAGTATDGGRRSRPARPPGRRRGHGSQGSRSGHSGRGKAGGSRAGPGGRRRAPCDAARHRAEGAGRPGSGAAPGARRRVAEMHGGGGRACSSRRGGGRGHPAARARRRGGAGSRRRP